MKLSIFYVDSVGGIDLQILSPILRHFVRRRKVFSFYLVKTQTHIQKHLYNCQFSGLENTYIVNANLDGMFEHVQNTNICICSNSLNTKKILEKLQNLIQSHIEYESWDQQRPITLWQESVWKRRQISGEEGLEVFYSNKRGDEFHPCVYSTIQRLSRITIDTQHQNRDNTTQWNERAFIESGRAAWKLPLCRMCTHVCHLLLCRVSLCRLRGNLERLLCSSVDAGNGVCAPDSWARQIYMFHISQEVC